MKELLKGDLKHFKTALIKVYPVTFRRLFKYWQFTLAGIFAIISAFYLDLPVRDLVKSLNGEFFNAVFNFGRWYGSGMPTIYLFFGLYLFGLILKKYKFRKTGLLILESYLFSGLVTLILKSVFGRFRPYTNKGDFAFYGWNLSNNDMFSYISGHAAVSFALSAILASTTENYYLKTFYYLLAVVTCLSRIYHNQHWFSDVLSGAISAYVISRALVTLLKKPDTDF
ncbi:MAG: phosphatase PAP2 family protein [Ignavibacteria bacterium]|nr:phosphatase PAP2 family protein [Ignavibacteria bacterium]